MAVPPGYVPYAQALPTFRYAGWWRRAVAFVLDGAVLMAFYVPGFAYAEAGPTRETTCFTGDGGVVQCVEPTAATAAIGLALMFAGIIGFLVLYCTMASRGGSVGHRHGRSCGENALVLYQLANGSVGHDGSLGWWGTQNRKYLCVIGSVAAGSQTSSSPSARTA